MGGLHSALSLMSAGLHRCPKFSPFVCRYHGRPTFFWRWWPADLDAEGPGPCRYSHAICLSCHYPFDCEAVVLLYAEDG